MALLTKRLAPSCYGCLQTIWASFWCDKDYTFLFYMESNHQSFQFYPLCIVLFFQLCFSQNSRENEDNVLISSTYICLQIQGITIRWFRVISMNLNQVRKKPYSNKHVSLCGYTWCETLHVFWLNSNPQPDVFWPNLDECFIHTILLWYLTPTIWHLLRRYFWIQFQMETWFCLKR